MSEFDLSCESTVDLPYDYVAGRGIEVLFYSYSCNGKTYEDDMYRHKDFLSSFYENLKNRKIPTTSTINTYQYETFSAIFFPRARMYFISALVQEWQLPMFRL